MAGDDQDKSQKTEQPTEKRLEDARKKGQIAKSQEVGHWFMMVGTAGMLLFLIGNAGHSLYGSLLAFVERPDQIVVGETALTGLFADVALDFAFAVLPIMGLLTVLAVAGNLVQHPLVISAEKIKPQLSKISPISGFKRLFSLNSLMEFGKGIAKLVIVSAVAFSLIWPDMQALPQLIAVDPLGVLDFVRHEAVVMVGGVLAVMTVIAGIDFAYQKWKNLQDLRMSKQDIKDERKNEEGDPEIKARIKRAQRQMMINRMMGVLPKADVVITNPTHYALALQYDRVSMAAPKVIAKGTDEVALKIRDAAKQHGIPIMEDPPLARSLYRVCKIGDEIPPSFYRAVATVLSHVLKMKQKAG